ncbi:tetratricopeptide repeat protein [Terracidiphilus gabretensis]|uniref:tetratricopeptide repeat protein n=1 Tax=Terracidiphilus gabretensis TaxID=1577687 RepID=UPI00071BF5D9|nr:tetratricopeptide repeat protein [Terracidiphilus gabretensis]
MNRPARMMALAVALGGMVLTLGGCNRLAARDHLNKGVEAFKSAHYEEAINHFQQATQLDPSLPMAKTYLATALAQNVVPGVTSKENLANADHSISLFQEVLDKDPTDVNSAKQIAAIYFQLNNFDKAKEWQKKVLSVDPKDAEAAYTIGVIDYTVAYKNAKDALAAAGQSDDGEGNVKAGKKVLQDIKDKNQALVDEGLQYLNQAIQNRANYDDAMVYINLVYRRKADLDYQDPNAVKTDVATAKDWASKALGARKANEEKKNAGPGGIVMDSSGNMK